MILQVGDQFIWALMGIVHEYYIFHNIMLYNKGKATKGARIESYDTCTWILDY